MTLFKNLQTEFRESSRREAEKITAETQKVIDEENLIRQSEMDKLRAENSTETTLMRQTQDAKIFDSNLEMEKMKAEK